MLLKYWDSSKTVVLDNDNDPQEIFTLTIINNGQALRKYFYDSLSEAMGMELEYLSRHVPFELEAIDGDLDYYSPHHGLWFSAKELGTIYKFPYPETVKVFGKLSQY